MQKVLVYRKEGETLMTAKKLTSTTMTAESELPRYEAPIVTTYRDEEILEKLGPAQTMSIYNGPD